MDSAQPSRVMRIATLAFVIFPFLGVLAGMILLWGHGFSWVELALLTIMYLATGLGVTLGFHRLFAHRSYQTLRPIALALAILGSMSAQGPVLHWIADHRRHHKHSDHEDDPHSPHGFGGGLFGLVRGFWHAHLGWLFTYSGPNVAKYVPDLSRDGWLRAINNLFPLWVTLGLLLPTVLGAAISQSWMGALLGFLWGGMIRLFLVHHLTWSINSVCHLWGAQPFGSKDQSRNNAFFGVIGFGEGWHNNHHAFPASARHGLCWWQLDVTYLAIWAMERLGLVWRVRLPSPQAVLAKQNTR